MTSQRRHEGYAIEKEPKVRVYGAGMPGSLQLGRIVWAEILDANGIPKLRPAVIVTPSGAGSLLLRCWMSLR